MDSKRNVRLWVLYDFANSIVAIVFFLYFAQWIVIDRGISDLHFNLTFTFSALLLLLTVPLTGVLLDKTLRRITGLRYTTVFTAIFYGICALAAVGEKEVLALVFYTLGLYSYLLSFTFYTPLLNDIASPQKRGKISGMGICANYIGQLVGLALVLPFSNGHWTLFHSAPRAETLLPAVIVFLLFSLPTLIFFKETQKPKELFVFGSELKQVVRKTKELFVYPGVFLFILAYFLFNDAILTAINNFPILLEQVWHISDSVKTYLLASIMITSAIGGYVAGSIADRRGHKKTLFIILVGWLVVFPLIALLTNFSWFVFVGVVMGFWYGATWTVSRSVMSYLCPDKRHNLAFAYFGLVERASSFVGPIVWGLVVGITSLGPSRYRVAVLAITGFIALSLVALNKVKSDRV